MSYVSITHVGNRHTDAVRGLTFYRDELKIMNARLDEVASKNNSFEARQGIEHFYNQFAIQEKNIHDIKHKIDQHVEDMGREAQGHQGRVEEIHVNMEKQLLEEYSELERVIAELRHEFNRFLSKWM
jgi:predicted  nucleic acid-binding Zn-ribbon protein